MSGRRGNQSVEASGADAPVWRGMQYAWIGEERRFGHDDECARLRRKSGFFPFSAQLPNDVGILILLSVLGVERMRERSMCDGRELII